ncbi:hypothetical protein SAMN04489835_5172 [Mycolicibacterium rutilum]|uniref:Ig-like domain-containing protein n=1 Tax=Mycolicibacterium rutilum TaxID=370526 RepID=A0A1H6LS41_MYCRU|nr:DUF6636 domain-containing protein [Mycolicibacterium rutilum]SEH87627.1 hypothetical protein SAMN04489835_5172 [Mycolicibacterium rutilum]
MVLARLATAAALIGAAPLLTPLPAAHADISGFTSPSGNIGCIIDVDHVRCDIAERDWAPPPPPTECRFDYGQGIVLQPGRGAWFVCAGDTALGGGAPLAYGDDFSAGVLRCESEPSGVTCRDVEDGHGFTISRQAYRLF